MYISTVDFNFNPINIICETLRNPIKNPVFIVENKKINFFPSRGRIQLAGTQCVNIPGHAILDTNNHSEALADECRVPPSYFMVFPCFFYAFSFCFVFFSSKGMKVFKGCKIIPFSKNVFCW